LREPCDVSSLAAQDVQTFFVVDAAAAVAWCDRTLRANLTYYRLRRELFAEFVALIDQLDIENRVALDEEIFISFKSFLTSRNDSLNDDKRLSFDRAVLQLRNAASGAIRRARAPGEAPPRRFMGLL
jgi:hypothetical protein